MMLLAFNGIDMDYKDIFTIASRIVIVVITYKVIADEIRIYKSKLHQPTDRITVNGRQLLEKVLNSMELNFGYESNCKKRRDP